MKIVVGLFDEPEESRAAIHDLENMGVPRADISILADESDKHRAQYAVGSASAAEDRTEVVVTDATAGAAIGGAAGLVMALTGIVIPGFGAVVAAGWLVATLTGAAVGAAAGGLMGALTGAGIPLEDAVYYKEGIRQGGTLLVVRALEERAAGVAAILSRHGAEDIHERAQRDLPADTMPVDAEELAPAITPTETQMEPLPSLVPMPELQTGIPGARVYPHVPPAE